MNKISALLGCIVLLLPVAGCNPKEGNDSGQSPLEDMPQAAVRETALDGVEEAEPLADSNELWDGTPPANDAIPDFFADAPEINEFPESVVGLWKTKFPNSLIKWEIKFEPNGSIKKIFHSLAGNINVDEGGVDGNVPGGSYYVFVMGPCEARYIPKTRTLKVKIIVDYFLFSFPAGDLEGRMEDYFEGPVSEDGKTWKADWRDFVWLKGAIPPDINLINANPVPLTFNKIEPNNSSE